MNLLKKLGNAFIRFINNGVAHNSISVVLQSEVEHLRNEARLVGALHWGAN